MVSPFPECIREDPHCSNDLLKGNAAIGDVLQIIPDTALYAFDILKTQFLCLDACCCRQTGNEIHLL
jgi:hypothetical protein